MNAQVRARRDARGFSFVELLVTIVIAGIVFVAMVPVFVGAQQKASGDRARSTALNVAQDRIEKIRALSYSQIVANKTTPSTTPNLYNSTWMGGQFGPSFTATSGSGGSKVYTVDYAVTEVGSGATVYKKVDVDVFWTAPPTPVKHVRLTTFVAKQYAGPQTTSLALSPMDNAGNLTAKPVVMTVTAAPGDISSMAVNGTAKGKVVFYVFSAVNGLQVATYTVNTGDAGNTVAGTYTASWDAATAADGDYSFRAQAYSASGDPGNVWQRTAKLLTSNAPPKVTGVTTSPGDARVTLNWAACAATDFDHYEVWMGTAPGAESDLGLGQLTANSYIKTGLTNDDTYYFVVYAVDKDGNKSPASDEVAETPTSMPGVNRPSTPGSFAAVAAGNTAKLTWTTSTQDGTSTLAGYYIYRDGASAAFATVDAGATTWSDTIGWATTHTYMIRAYNAAGRKSIRSATLSVTTGAATKHDLTVKNTSGSNGPTIYVWVQSTTTFLWWLSANPSTSTSTKPVTGKAIAKNGKTAVWYQLPYDTYTVSTSGGLAQTLNPAVTPSVGFIQ